MTIETSASQSFNSFAARFIGLRRALFLDVLLNFSNGFQRRFSFAFYPVGPGAGILARGGLHDRSRKDPSLISEGTNIIEECVKFDHDICYRY